MRKKCPSEACTQYDSEWIRSGEGKFHSLCDQLTLILILPSASSSREFFTRMFSSFKSRCTMSVRCEEENFLQRHNGFKYSFNMDVTDKYIFSISC